MRVQEIMTEDPTCCTPDASLQDVARTMLEHDCGEVPIVDDRQRMHPVGVITDRDIVLRTICKGRNPFTMTARDCMPAPVATIDADATVEECFLRMERKRVRRLPVVDSKGSCCGTIAQAGIAQYAPDKEAAELVREVSRPCCALPA